MPHRLIAILITTAALLYATPVDAPGLPVDTGAQVAPD